jgi:ABC-2 type transport system permease protein
MIERVRRMLVKEFLQMLRDPRMRMVVLVMPVVQMVVIAFALTTDVHDIGLGVLDGDGTPSSRALIRGFTAAGWFHVIRDGSADRDLERWLDRGEVRVVVRILPGFEGSLREGRSAAVQLILDGTNPNDASIILGYAREVVDRFASAEDARRIAMALPAGAERPALDLRVRAWFNPNLESKYYFVPGLIPVMLMVVSLLLTSIAIVREREIGTIEQILVTPIRRVEFILGKTLPFLIMGYIIMTLMFAALVGIFGVHVQGSWLLLYATAGIYLAGNLGLALFISASASTQQQALLTAFLILMPGVLLSGFMFPIRNMPVVVQYASMINPMRWFLEILHGIAVKSAGVGTLWHAIAAQLGLAVLFLVLAGLRFKKTVA